MSFACGEYYCNTKMSEEDFQQAESLPKLSKSFWWRQLPKQSLTGSVVGEVAQENQREIHKPGFWEEATPFGSCGSDLPRIAQCWIELFAGLRLPPIQWTK